MVEEISNDYNVSQKSQPSAEPTTDATLAPKMKTVGKGSRGQYRSWKTGVRKTAMDAAVAAHMVGDDALEAARKVIPWVDIPRQTLMSKVRLEEKRVRLEETQMAAAVNRDDALDVFDRKQNRQS